MKAAVIPALFAALVLWLTDIDVMVMWAVSWSICLLGMALMALSAGQHVGNPLTVFARARKEPRAWFGTMVDRRLFRIGFFVAFAATMSNNVICFGGVLPEVPTLAGKLAFCGYALADDAVLFAFYFTVFRLRGGR